MPGGMTFNQFQRELQKRGIEGHTAIVLTEMFSQQRETAEQLDQAMNILLALTKTVENFVGLNEAMSGRLAELTRRVAGEEAGMDLSSVPLRDEPN